MRTGVKLFHRTKRSGQKRKARREMVEMRRKMTALEERIVDSHQSSTDASSGPGVKMGTIRALERRIQERDQTITVLTEVLADVASHLPAKARKQLSDNTKLVLKLE